ncbi:MAG: protein kinase, partial [Chloroflexi bacterium]|nr:protein kinase [Chloroflexota bacterium]
MQCASCSHENPEGSQFCESCGARLAPVCPACGAEVSQDARFCKACGHELDRPPPAARTPTPAPAPALPASFASGRYQVQRFLGEGGMKRVYLAHDGNLNRDVAIALIKSEGLTEEGIARIQREGQTMGQLGDHPNIVTAYDADEEAGQHYFVMEYMAGGDLEALIQSNDGEGLPLEDALRIGDEIAQALEHAHGHGIIHRDLKPGNIWLTEDRTAKLGDFGFVLAADRSRLTQAGMMIGTPYCMPPEQALGAEVTAASDLYSLGCVLYEMVAGRPPFPGDDPTAVISQHINNAPVAPSWHTDQCPPDLEELILKLLAKAPDDRPQSAAEVREALGRVDPTEKSASHEQGNVLDRLARGVFVGREKELDGLRKAFDEAFAGHGSIVMLVGEPGIGKTRAAQELETYARMRGAQVLWGTNHEAAGAPPYQPWVQVGRTYGSTHDVAETGADMEGAGPDLVTIFPELRRLVPNFQEPEPSTDPESAQFRLFDAYVRFVRAMSVRTPILIALDDLHWTDKGSLLLLQHLARELSRMRVLIVCTYRDTDLVRTHPLSEALVTLNRESGFQRIALRGLTLGVVGVGNIGRLVTAWGETIGLRVLRCDPPRARTETEGDAAFVPFETILTEADVITFHVPLVRGGPDATYHYLNKENIGRLKPGCILFNTSRGAVIDSVALLAALQPGRLGPVVLDVWEHEPAISPQLVDRVSLGTAHIAGYSYDGKLAGTKIVQHAAVAQLGIGTPWDPSPHLSTSDGPARAVRIERRV